MTVGQHMERRHSFFIDYRHWIFSIHLKGQMEPCLKQFSQNSTAQQCQPRLRTHVSDQEKDLLKMKLDQLQCHFTLAPQKNNIDLDNMKQSLEDSIQPDVKDYNQLAFVNCLQGNCEEAIQNLQEAEKILRENNEDKSGAGIIVTYGNRAWVNYHMGQLTEAQSYLDKLETVYHPFPNASQFFGIYWWNGKFPTTAMIPEVYGEKGWSLLSSTAEYYEEAKECFKKALEEDPDHIEWNFGFATALVRLEDCSSNPENSEFSEYMNQLRRVLELDPGHAEAKVLLALKLQDLNQKEEAFTLVEQALQKYPDLPFVIRYVAKFLRREGAVDKSIELLKKALEITPNCSFLHHQTGLCYKNKLLQLIKNPRCRNLRDPVFQQKIALIKQCKQHFGEAFLLKQSFIIAKLAFAEICAMNEEYREAKEIYKTLLELENITLENKQEKYFGPGKVEFFHKNSESNAIKYYLEGIKIQHNSRAREWCRTTLFIPISTASILTHTKPTSPNALNSTEAESCAKKVPSGVSEKQNAKQKERVEKRSCRDRAMNNSREEEH
ncbi:interferon-induced protein with tetratricopeptide repeats 5-like [Mustelus asterias]